MKLWKISFMKYRDFSWIETRVEKKIIFKWYRIFYRYFQPDKEKSF